MILASDGRPLGECPLRASHTPRLGSCDSPARPKRTNPLIDGLAGGAEVSEAAIGTTIKAYCGRCGGERNCEVKGVHNERSTEGDGQFDFSWHTAWHLLVCRGCDYPFTQTISTDSETYHDFYNHDGDHEREYIETIETWPAKEQRVRPEWFAHSRVEGSHLIKAMPLNTALNELYRALDAGLSVLSSIGIRTAFDAASELLGVEPGLQFAEKLTALTEGGKIRASEQEDLEVLIGAGSAAAHRGWKPTTKQLNVQMDILEGFIFNSMVFPAREKAKAEQVEELKKAVPPKQVRPKKARVKAKPTAADAKAAPPEPVKQVEA